MIRRHWETCPLCGKIFPVVNKYKRVCRDCRVLIPTKGIALGKGLREGLEEKIKEGKGIWDIAMECNVDIRTVMYWMKKAFGKTYREVKRTIYEDNDFVL
uniref:Uncharacterized protein n=1 Tax=candidate division CPR3 bacterium TaxID=2268181 RepID=A0A7V3N4W4_UNCC3